MANFASTVYTHYKVKETKHTWDKCKCNDLIS